MSDNTKIPPKHNPLIKNKTPLKGGMLPLFKVNLLISKTLPIKFYIKLIRWLMSSGRYMVIFVEFIVISAFVFRYQLDSTLGDLNDKIKEQSIYIKSLKNDENLIKQTQFQLSSIKQIKNSNPNYAQIILNLSQQTPKGIVITNISFNQAQTISKTTISISGESRSNTELSAFIKSLQKDPQFTGITLTNISFTGQTIFTITGNINGLGKSS